MLAALKTQLFAIHHTHLAGALKALILIAFSTNKPFKLYCEATTHQAETPILQGAAVYGGDYGAI